MFLNKIYKNKTTLDTTNKKIEHFLKVFNKTFKKPKISKAFKHLKRLKRRKVYKYLKLKQSKLKLKTGIFRYVIGLKKTSTNLYYNVAKIDGKVVLYNTKNRVLAKFIEPTQNPNTRKSDLYYMLKAIKHETRNKMRRNSLSFPCLLHVQNFKRYVVKEILKKLSRFCNIRALIITNTNPHNGCRPPKIKTNTKLRFSTNYKKTKVVITDNFKYRKMQRRKMQHRKNPNIIYIPRKIKKEWLSGLKR